MKIPKFTARGFTLVELLVVIAIIGILAATVLAAINPIEQINKGRDTGRRSTSAELVSAVERYYAAREEFVFDDTVEEDDPWASPAGGWTWVWAAADSLVSSGEIKPGFASRFQDETDDYVSFKPANDTVFYVCFEPQSKQFKQEAADNCVGGERTAVLNGQAPAGVNLCAVGSEMICIPE